MEGGGCIWFCAQRTHRARDCVCRRTKTNRRLLKFDFRNGSLRKKYDGVKYVVRDCEKILYDLSLSRARRKRGGGGGGGDTDMPPAKRQKVGHVGGGGGSGGGGGGGGEGSNGSGAAAVSSSAAAAAAAGEGVSDHPTLLLLDQICERYKVGFSPLFSRSFTPAFIFFLLS